LPLSNESGNGVAMGEGQRSPELHGKQRKKRENQHEPQHHRQPKTLIHDG
jgi:hypothetical protein